MLNKQPAVKNCSTEKKEKIRLVHLILQGDFSGVQLLDKSLVMKPRRSHHVKTVRVEEIS